MALKSVASCLLTLPCSEKRCVSHPPDLIQLPTQKCILITISMNETTNKQPNEMCPCSLYLMLSHIPSGEADQSESESWPFGYKRWFSQWVKLAVVYQQRLDWGRDLGHSVLKIWLQAVRVKCALASAVKFSFQVFSPSFLAILISFISLLYKT